MPWPSRRPGKVVRNASDVFTEFAKRIRYVTRSGEIRATNGIIDQPNFLDYPNRPD
jgi:hypothetical protein